MAGEDSHLDKTIQSVSGRQTQNAALYYYLLNIGVGSPQDEHKVEAIRRLSDVGQREAKASVAAQLRTKIQQDPELASEVSAFLEDSARTSVGSNVKLFPKLDAFVKEHPIERYTIPVHPIRQPDQDIDARFQLGLSMRLKAQGIEQHAGAIVPYSDQAMTAFDKLFDDFRMQTRGVLDFQRVDDPREAAIRVTANNSGQIFYHYGVVFAGSQSTTQEHGTGQEVRHELLHALGFAHPHDSQSRRLSLKGDVPEVVTNATYAQTIMTYPQNSMAGAEDLQAKPLVVGVADVQALQRFYPSPAWRKEGVSGQVFSKQLLGVDHGNGQASLHSTQPYMSAVAPVPLDSKGSIFITSLVGDTPGVKEGLCRVTASQGVLVAEFDNGMPGVLAANNGTRFHVTDKKTSTCDVTHVIVKEGEKVNMSVADGANARVVLRGGSVDLTDVRGSVDVVVESGNSSISASAVDLSHVKLGGESGGYGTMTNGTGGSITISQAAEALKRTGVTVDREDAQGLPVSLKINGKNKRAKDTSMLP